MLRFLIRRSLGAVVILLIISAVTFFLFYAVPRDPATLACGKNCTPDALAVIRKNMGIDEPVPVQYFHFMVGIVAGRQFNVGGRVRHRASATPSPTRTPSGRPSWTASPPPSR